MKVVIVNCFETYENRVELLKTYFENTGNTVTVYTADYCHFKKCKRQSAPEGFQLINTKPYEKNLSVKRLSSHADFAKKVFSELEAIIEQVDMVWVMLPPNSLAKQMAALKQNHKNVCLIFDIIDMWPETMPLRRVEGIWPLTQWKKMRNRNLKYADAVVTECCLYQEKIKDCVAENRLFNLYFAKKHTVAQPENERRTDCLELCYLGSVNNIIDIDVIGEILVQLSKQTPVKLHVIGDGERKDALLESARAAGAEVEYHGVIFDDSAKGEILSRCHFGLNIMKDSVFVGLTMKSMDYFVAGLPMINNIKGDTCNIIEKNGFGVNYPFDTEDLMTMKEQETVRRRMREFYEEHFSVQAFEKELSHIMESVNANRN